MEESCAAGRSRLLTIAASAVLLAATLAISPGPVARGQQVPPNMPYPDPQPYLTVHGPNDGEPLNNSQDLLINAFGRSYSRSYVFVCYGSRMLSSAALNSQMYAGSQCVTAPVDFTQFENGPCVLTVLLVNDRMETLASTDWLTQIRNPTLTTVGNRMGSQLVFSLRGKPGDVEYRLLAGDDYYQLRRSPFGESTGAGVETVVFGGFPQPAELSTAENVSSDESVDIVLNIDNLIRAHTLDGFLVLWTRGMDANIAYSRHLPLASLAASQSPTVDPAETDPPSSTYNR